MAYIGKYRDGWRAQVYRDGNRATKTFKTKRDAQAWAIRAEAELEAKGGPGNNTLLYATEHYLKTVSSTKRAGAHEWERRRFDAMLAHFGETTPVSKITSEDIGKWRDKRLETVSSSTWLRESNLLRHLFTLAVDEWQWIPRNPFKGVRLPKENSARHQLWRWKQIKQVLRAGQRSGGKTGEVTRAFHLSLRTGMRLQEALAAPDNFDAQRKVVSVVTKTSPRPEEIPIGRLAAKLLVGEKFTVGPNEASTLFSKLTKSLMIDDLTFHDARATALTLLAKRVDVMVLARISRHKDISLLHRVYYRTSTEEIASKL